MTSVMSYLCAAAAQNGYAGAGRSQQVVTECVGCFGLSGLIAGCE